MKAYSLLSHTSIFFVGFARCLRVAISSLVHTAPKKTNFVASFCGIYSLVTMGHSPCIYLLAGNIHCQKMPSRQFVKIAAAASFEPASPKVFLCLLLKL